MFDATFTAMIFQSSWRTIEMCFSWIYYGHQHTFTFLWRVWAFTMDCGVFGFFLNCNFILEFLMWEGWRMRIQIIQLRFFGIEEPTFFPLLWRSLGFIINGRLLLIIILERFSIFFALTVVLLFSLIFLLIFIQRLFAWLVHDVMMLQVKRYNQRSQSHLYLQKTIMGHIFKHNYIDRFKVIYCWF